MPPSSLPSPEPVTRPAAGLPSSTTTSVLSSAPASPSSTTSQRPWPTPLAEAAMAADSFPPMTTHWSKPQSCTWTYVADNSSRPVSSGATAWLDLQPIPGASTLSCYPDGMFFEGRTGIFSPATCPSGWTTVSVLVSTETDLTEPITTTAVCCSSHFTLDGSHCKRPVQTLLAVPITYDATVGTYEIMSTSTTILYSATMAVNAIRALFRDEDMKLLGLTDDEEISEDEVHDDGSSFPLGGRVGIAIGVTAFSLLCITTFIFCLWRWRRIRRKHAKELGPHELGNVPGPRSRAGDAFGRREVDAVEPPPPAYQASEPGSCHGDQEIGEARQNEMRSLVAQRDAIEKRIAQLERMDAEEPPTSSR